MKPSRVMTEMIDKKRQWTFKAPDRTWFTLSATYDSTTIDRDRDDDFFETIWEVKLKHENGQTSCLTLTTTQFDQMPDLHNVLMAVASYFNSIVLTAAQYSVEMDNEKETS